MLWVHSCYIENTRVVILWSVAFPQKSQSGAIVACILTQVDSDLAGVREWLGGKMGEEVCVDSARGKLTDFIMERFVPHQPAEEHYIW